MSHTLTVPEHSSPAPAAPARRGRLLRTADRRERRRRARQDEVSARLAELHLMKALLEDAADVVASGWVQHAWFSYRCEQGHEHTAVARPLHMMEGSTVTGACLVGAIVHSGGGPASVRTQLVQRSLDIAWHALYEDEGRSVRWCPAPSVRMAHVRDLTRWNDHPQRRAEEVHALLETAGQATVLETERLRGSLVAR